VHYQDAEKVMTQMDMGAAVTKTPQIKNENEQEKTPQVEEKK
jgi:hypothetical protein